ncbi:DinB family protein [Gorillibacterium timonense]|uniref:DinB family protein n=1 Tax=Gorillibacterium timonense TaxID=1689269 RepID=UPI00071D2AFD|nr:DinB family protein [Gorillibacterium timonense]
MKRLNDPEVRGEIRARIERLAPDSARRFGKMTVGQMLCHLSDQLRDVAGIRPVPGKRSFFMERAAKPVAFYLLPRWPGGFLPTAPEFDAMRAGTKPSAFLQDKEELLALFDSLTISEGEHPAFGPLSAREYGRLLYKHFDHHLRQFGV